MTSKDLAGLQKKHEKVKDWKYLSQLYRQCDEDTRRILTIERDNKKLKAEQKKSEWKLTRQLNQRGDNLFTDEIGHQELVELDNEIKVLRHKADYVQEKLFKE